MLTVSKKKSHPRKKCPSSVARFSLVVLFRSVHDLNEIQQYSQPLTDDIKTS